MALTDYKVAFDNSYQENFYARTVAKDIMNMRLEPMLTYGGSVTRVNLDLSAAIVRTVTRGSASTIDSISDTPESLTINIEKEIAFHISDGEVTQTGPLKAMQVAGSENARKLAIDLDGRCFAEVVNALFSFDNGDLTTGTSSGTPITLNATTVPQLVSRMSAKLETRNNVDVSTNMALVVDSYAASDIDQYLLAKNIDLAGAVFKNGFAGPIKSAQLYVSNNLTNTSVLSLATNVTANDTITYNGVTWTAKAVPSVAGEFDIGSDADATRVILANAFNGSATGQNSATGYFEVSAANRLLLAGVVATDSPSANTLTIVRNGGGRVLVSETLTDATDTWSANFLNCYYGKKGAIDLVVQDMKEVDIRPTADRRGNNIFSSYLAGIKTFTDGSKKFLNVKISVA